MTAGSFAQEVPSRSDRLQRVELGMPGQEEFELVGGSPRHVEWTEVVRLMVVIRDGVTLDGEAVEGQSAGDQSVSWPGRRHSAGSIGVSSPSETPAAWARGPSSASS